MRSYVIDDGGWRYAANAPTLGAQWMVREEVGASSTPAGVVASARGAPTALLLERFAGRAEALVRQVSAATVAWMRRTPGHSGLGPAAQNLDIHALLEHDARNHASKRSL